MIGDMTSETPFDLRWRMFGVNIRVHPMFWLISGLLSWHWMQFGFQYVLIEMACVFVSILVHEFGHVIAGNCFGSRGHIVLWGLGGLAIGSSNCNKRWQRIVVSLAGPFAQFILLGLTLAVMPFVPQVQPGELGFKIVLIPWSGIYHLLPVVLLESLIIINLFWPIINLLPIWPLDGGKVSRELFTAASPRDGVRLSLHLSIGMAALIAFYFLFAHLNPDRALPFLPGSVFNAVLFGLLALSSFQALQLEMARNNWRDDPWN